MGEFRTGNVAQDHNGNLLIVSKVNKDTIEWVDFSNSNSSGITLKEPYSRQEICYECEVHGKDEECINCQGEGSFKKDILGFSSYKFLADNVESYIKNRLLKNFEF